MYSNYWRRYVAMSPSYKVRVLRQPRRRLAPHLMRSIVQLLEEAGQPLEEAELLAVLRRIYHRLDVDFQRQVRLNLSDGVSYGILRRSKDFVELRAERLGELMAALAP